MFPIQNTFIMLYSWDTEENFSILVFYEVPVAYQRTERTTLTSVKSLPWFIYIYKQSLIE